MSQQQSRRRPARRSPSSLRRDSTTQLIPKSLPVIIMPYWDDAPFARFAIPGWDGNACLFRLLGKYGDRAMSQGIFRGVDREIREKKTVEWLKRPGGVWKNGWYEDLNGEKRYSDVIATDQKSQYEVPMRQFDTFAREELDCVNTADCKEFPVTDHWGSKFTTADQPLSISSVAVSNGNRFGLFLFEQEQLRTVKSIYDWETLISNISIAGSLIRWVMSMYAVQYGYFRNHTRWHNAGIGCLANSRSFNLLPRLKITLSAFLTVGCKFEGEQKALSEAWFVKYPAILELLLLYFSLLNIAAKILRRRVSDEPFGPAVLFFCLLHWFRLEIAQSKSRWFGIDGRVTPRVVSTEFEKLKLVDFFISDVAFRLNGSVTSLFVIKLVVLALNLLPLLLVCAYRRYTGGNLKQNTTADAKIPNGIERILALNSYELVRLGFVVFGSRHLIALEDWEIVSTLWPLRSFYRLWSHRVTLFTLQDATDSGVEPRFGSGGSSSSSSSSSSEAKKTLSDAIQICRLDGPKLQRIASWKITGRPIQ